MKKVSKLLALVLSLAMCAALAACGSKTTTPSTNAATTPAPAGNETEAQVEASELKVGVFYYTFADPYISSVRTALDAQLDSLELVKHVIICEAAALVLSDDWQAFMKYRKAGGKEDGENKRN